MTASDTPANKKSRKRWKILTVCLALFSLWICLRIEWYIYQDARQLPVQAGSGKWRWINAELLERKTSVIYREGHGIPENAELTPAQKRAVDALFTSHWGSRETIARRNQFYGFIVLFGLLQYLAVPAVMVLAWVNFQQNTSALLLLAALSTFCALMMFYRGYLSSLGW